MGRAVSTTQAAVGVLVLLRSLDAQSCTLFNIETTTASHPLCFNLTLILHGQSHLQQYPLYLILSVALTPNSNSLSMMYCLMASLNSFMLGYKPPGSITGLFLSNITLSPGRCWNIRITAELSSQIFSPLEVPSPHILLSYFTRSSSPFNLKTK
jgi:hypothetical protein